MTKRNTVKIATAGAALLLSLSIHAEVRTEEKDQVKIEGMLGKMASVFGGKSMRDGVVSKVAIKGDRKITVHEKDAEIVDLKERKIYHLDLTRRVYSALSFDEMQNRMQESRRKLEAEMQDRKARAEKAPQQPLPPTSLQIDVDIKNSGQTRAIHGMDAHELVMTIAAHEKGKAIESSGGIAIVSHMWMVPKVPALREIAEFDVRFAREMATAIWGSVTPEDTAALTAMYPMFQDAVIRLRSEVSKIEGTTLDSETTVELVSSAEEMAKQQNAHREEPAIKLNRGISGLLGGMAARAAGKKLDADPEPQQRARLLTMTHQVVTITNDVTDADVAIPAGFREVSPSN